MSERSTEVTGFEAGLSGDEQLRSALQRIIDRGGTRRSLTRYTSRQVAMLDHAGDAVLVFVGAWRFLLSEPYRAAKLAEWRAARQTLSGKATIAGEILGATAVGILLPLWLIALVVSNL